MRASEPAGEPSEEAFLETLARAGVVLPAAERGRVLATARGLEQAVASVDAYLRDADALPSLETAD